MPSETNRRGSAAAKRTNPSKGKSSEPSGAEAGQEATRGQQPTDRDTTHQSNYGGGGTHGGKKK